MADDPLSRTFAALADPTRRALLARLADGPATVNELAAPHAMTLAAVSKHLTVLERAGLVSQERQAQRRPRHLDATPLRQADDWLRTYHAFFADRLDALEQQLRADGSSPDPSRPEPSRPEPSRPEPS